MSMKNFLKNTTSGITTLVLVLILPMMSLLYAQQDHRKIVEEVSVSWWQVPVFAVDKSGNPVADLEPGDIKVELNGRQIPSFTLQKHSFSVTKEVKDLVKDVPNAKQLPIRKKKMLFFVFDQVLSGEITTRRAKKIAKKIVKDTGEDTQFFVLTVEPFNGLVYIGQGSSSNKELLLKMINTKVKEKRVQRIMDPGEIMGCIQCSYTESDLDLFNEAVSKHYLRKSRGYFYAFDTLYSFLNGIEDNKFIYLFTEGMSQSIFTQNKDFGGTRGLYYLYFKRMAHSLNRCGSMLFIINAMGVDQYHSRITHNKLKENWANIFPQHSGENSLQLLVKETGGTYLEGTDEKIVSRLENMHRAYYLIAFPDIPHAKNLTRKVSITSTRKDIKIHSPHTLEKQKNYRQLNTMEKEMLVLNLLTQPQHLILNNKILAYNARVTKTEKRKNDVIYTVKLPPGYLRQSIDLYKVWLNADEQDISQVEKIETASLYPEKNKLEIRFQLTEEIKKQRKEKKETANNENKTYFVLVNRDLEPARVLVHGLELYEEDPQLLKLDKMKIAENRKKSAKNISIEEMKNILQGAADYCDRLKQSAFHFYCREKILETRIPLSSAEKDDPYFDENLKTRSGMVALRQIRDKAYTQIKSYLFGYRLIKQGNKIKEERDWIASNDDIKIHYNQVLKPNAFYSEKAVFAPITLLDHTRQDKYDYQFIRFDQQGDRRAAVIEAVPKNLVETASIYGILWIDTEDFSVLKIEANPKSINSYKLLKNVAKKLRTKLYLSLVITFDRLYRGIRFPTQGHMLEKYRGGRIISEHQGPKGWERNRTQFFYSDYQFFNVQTDIAVQKVVTHTNN